MNLLSSPEQNSCLGVAHMPQGFRSSLVKRSRIDTEVSMTTQRPWARPEKLALSSEWLVADGDESKEASLQKDRELRVLEAFYPRLASIPDSPAEPADICTTLHDSLCSTVPLVPIEEEDDEISKESGQGLETSEKIHVLDESFEHEKLMEDLVPEHPASSPSSFFAQEAIQHVHNFGSSNADPKVAAAAVAAACLTFHERGASGPVDPDLLVEILRNPTLLKSLNLFNQVSQSPAEASSGHKLSTASLFSPDHSHALQHNGPPNKPSTCVSHNTGLPSPVSVLSDWTHAKSSESMNAPSLPTMCCSLPPKHLHNLHSTREGFLSLESDPVHGLHAWSHEVRVGISTSCIPKASAQTTLLELADSSSVMVAPLAPFPSQSGVHFHPNNPEKVQSAQRLAAKGGEGMISFDSMRCRSSHSESRFRRIESSGICGMTKLGPRTTRLCMYFNSARGCRNGGNCAFLHQSGSPELNAVAQ